MDPFVELKQSFLEECDELLASLEKRLMALEEGSTSSDDINGAFRAIHSIKGGAGAFGFPTLVELSHVFEAALDHLRSGRMTLAAAPLPLFLRAADAVSSLVAAAREDRTPAMPHQLIRELQDVWQPGSAPTVVAPDPSTNSATVTVAVGFSGLAPDVGPEEEDALVRVSLHPLPNLFRRAVEPRAVIGGLDVFGPVSVTTLTDKLPPFDQFDALDCYLGFDLEIRTTAKPEKIAEALALQLFAEEFTIHPADAEIGEPDDWSADTAPADLWASTASPSDLWQSSAPETDMVPSPTDSWDSAPAGGVMPLLSPDVTEPAHSPSPVAQAAMVEPVTGAVPDPVSSYVSASAAATAAAPLPASPASRLKAKQTGSIRVDLERIDKLMNLVGEIVITQSMLDQRLLSLSVAETVQIADGLQVLSRQTRELQEYVMAVRAQPVRNVFQRIPRMVRELAQSLDKEARLVMRGEDTEVDKTIIEELSDPLIHMIRNSMDHGIEPAAERLAAGKPAEGTITLQAEQRGARIVITISDDGRGINREKLLAKARQRGLVPHDVRPAPDEIDALIFHPGLSTADSVTDVSGRGVGMDVVKQNVEALGGRIMVVSDPGRGSRFTLLLPLTLAVMDGMIIRAGGERLVLPIASIIETLQFSETTVETLPGGQSFLRLRDELLPLVRLGAALGLETAGTEPIIVLTETDQGERIGLAVDEIISQQQVVVKSLEASYGRVPGASAATILGDGLVALIVDVDSLLGLSTAMLKPLRVAA